MGGFSFPKTIARPCVPLTVALMAGLVLGNHLPDTLPSFFPVFLLLLGITFLLPIFWSGSFSLPAGCCFLMVVGISQVTMLSPKTMLPQVPPWLVDQQPHHFSGVIVQEPLHYPDRTRLVVGLTTLFDQGEDRAVQGTILLGLKGPVQELSQGDPVRFLCRLRPIEGYRNPGGFDFQERMNRKGIRVSGFIEDSELLIRGGPNQRSWPWQRLTRIRKQVSHIITIHLKPPSNGLAQALLTGEQGQIPREVREAFNQAGVAHLLAFSGLNLGLIGGLSFFLFRYLLSLSEGILLTVNVRRWALIGSFLPVLGYALLAGLSPSVARALFMVSLVMLALLLKKNSDLLNSLALAALVLLLFSPEALFLPSFQLSFISVWAIAYLLPRIWNPAFPGTAIKRAWIRRGIYYLWGTFCVSLVTQLATLPIVAWWFHQISLVGLISNLVLVPLTGALVTPIGLLGLLLNPLSPAVSAVLFGIMERLLEWTLWWVQFFAGWPLAFMPMSRPGVLEMAFFFLTCLVLFNWKMVPRPFVLVSFSALATVILFFLPQIHDFLGSSFKITFLDVGHGNAALIEFPGGKKMLVDGGGSPDPEFDLGERVVGPFLWGEKIRRLETVVLTHPHPDHLNGLPFILSKFKVGELWENGHQGDSEVNRRLEQIIGEKKISCYQPLPGWSRSFGEAQVRILNPPPGKFQEGRSGNWHHQNNASLVLRVSCQDQHILLPGDIEAEAEALLVASGRRLESQILQVPHHGSLTSSHIPFIEAVQPRQAVISARSSRRFPVPHPEVIKRYQDRQIRVFRTDREGAITFTLKAAGWEIKTFSGGRWLVPRTPGPHPNGPAKARISEAYSARPFR